MMPTKCGYVEASSIGTTYLLMLQWYILVLKVTRGGLKGYSGVKWISKMNTPPSYTEPGGPRIVLFHSNRLSP